jgi:predicted DNA-binding protein (UPF0278 family)
MHWWVISVACICLALLVQYTCSNRILRMRQGLSLRSMAVREARNEAQELDEQSAQVRVQQTSLAHTIDRLRPEIRRLRAELRQKGVPLPEPTFDLALLGEEAPATAADPEGAVNNQAESA